MRRGGRRQIAGLVGGLALVCSNALAEEGVPAESLRLAVVRQVENLPSAALGAPPGDCGPGGTATCCKDGCRGAAPPPAEVCAGTIGKGSSFGLGALAGTGLGLGLGRATSGALLAREFRPFALTESLITAGSLAIALVGFKAVERKPPALCRGGFSGCDGAVDSLRGIDAYARRHWALASFRGRERARNLSYLTLASTLVLPSAFLLGSDQPAQGRELLLSVESGAITAAVLQVVKHRVNRPRPYAHYCRLGCGDDLGERDTQLSFFSEHTAVAFSFAVSAGTIASMRSYKNAGWVLGSGLTLAAATGYLRIAADRHYFTDVLMGALVGAAAGWAVPKLHGLRDRPVGAPTATERRPPSRPTLVLPVPLRGPEGGLWLHGGVGGDASGIAFSWSF
jgi:membrane-associated phospholipid phosphatase